MTTVNKNVFSGPNTSLPSQIFANANSPFVGAQARGWGAALAGALARTGGGTGVVVNAGGGGEYAGA